MAATPYARVGRRQDADHEPRDSDEALWGTRRSMTRTHVPCARLDRPGRPRPRRAAMNPAVAAWARTGLVGAATGLRSTWGLAAISWATGPSSAVPAAVRRPRVRGATLVAAMTELVADKSPHVPGRLSPAGLAPRLLIGAALGAALSRRRPGEGVPPVAGAAIGAATAFAAAFAGTRWRRTATGAHQAWTDPMAAAVEDIATAALAWIACALTTEEPPG
ncbi:DUF4126 family protein [Streptomyces bauhiniae]|uniref:DUF4126 family protein n=1 Tax=Streptomyces bauhiniae TaxID=2340725 RepID=UPI003316C085